MLRHWRPFVYSILGAIVGGLIALIATQPNNTGSSLFFMIFVGPAALAAGFIFGLLIGLYLDRRYTKNLSAGMDNISTVPVSSSGVVSVVHSKSVKRTFLVTFIVIIFCVGVVASILAIRFSYSIKKSDQFTVDRDQKMLSMVNEYSQKLDAACKDSGFFHGYKELLPTTMDTGGGKPLYIYATCDVSDGSWLPEPYLKCQRVNFQYDLSEPREGAIGQATRQGQGDLFEAYFYTYHALKVCSGTPVGLPKENDPNLTIIQVASASENKVLWVTWAFRKVSAQTKIEICKQNSGELPRQCITRIFSHNNQARGVVNDIQFSTSDLPDKKSLPATGVVHAQIFDLGDVMTQLPGRWFVRITDIGNPTISSEKLSDL